MTKTERIAALESRVAELKAELDSTEWELELLKGSGPMLDKFFSEIDASDRTYAEVIEFLSTCLWPATYPQTLRICELPE